MDIVPVQHGNTASNLGWELLDLNKRSARMDSLRKAQDEHHHKQIWTKDAHGGPYIKEVRKEHDVAAEGLQRAMVLGSTSASPRPEDLLGYERIAAEATVGHHHCKPPL